MRDKDHGREDPHFNIPVPAQVDEEVIDSELGFVDLFSRRIGNKYIYEIDCLEDHFWFFCACEHADQERFLKPGQRLQLCEERFLIIMGFWWAIDERRERGEKVHKLALHRERYIKQIVGEPRWGINERAFWIKRGRLWMKQIAAELRKHLP